MLTGQVEGHHNKTTLAQTLRTARNMQNNKT